MTESEKITDDFIKSCTESAPKVNNTEMPAQHMTKREAFAMAAMQAIIPSYMSKPVSLDDIDSPQRLAAQWSIKFADELLKQLES